MTEAHFKIRLTPDPGDTWIELNGMRLGRVTEFAVKIDAKTNLPVVTMAMAPSSIEGTIIEPQESMSEESIQQTLAIAEEALRTEGATVSTTQQKVGMRSEPTGFGTPPEFIYDGTATHININAFKRKPGGPQ